MKTNAKKNKNENQVPTVGNGIKHEHPGRPRYTMVFPSTLTFTFTELMRANGVCTDKSATMKVPSTRKNGKPKIVSLYGKGDNCTMLTIRKNIKFDLARGEVYLMKGYTAVPDSNGLGRRGLLYRHSSTPFSDALAEAKVRGAESLTDEVSAPQAKVTRKSRKSDTAAVNKTIADAQAILAESASTVAIPAAPSTISDAVHNPIVVPVAETAPVVPVTPAATAPEVSVPIAEPVVPTPAPAAPVAETASVVPAETAPVAA